MKQQYAKNTCLVLLLMTLSALVGGCSTTPVTPSSTESRQSASAMEPGTIQSPPPANATNSLEPSPVIEPQAMDALHKMGAFLRSLKTFNVNFKVSKDEVLDLGQKVMVDGVSALTVQFPDNLHLSTKIEEVHRDQQFFYNGKTFTIYGNTNKYYASVPAPATIRELLDTLQERYNLEMPFRDLFVWGTDRADEAAIWSAIYIGPTKIDNVTCDHYAFRNQDVDWQIWIQQGETPLPKKLVITTTQEEQHPQFAAVMTWNLAPKIDSKIFTFVPPKDAHKISFAENPITTENSK